MSNDFIITSIEGWHPCPCHHARVPHISLVFREMWDTTDLNPRGFAANEQTNSVEVRGIPHLAKNERDVGHPSVVAGTELFLQDGLDQVARFVYIDPVLNRQLVGKQL
jgi:hypothetical protein